MSMIKMAFIMMILMGMEDVGKFNQIQLHLCSLYQHIKYSRKWVWTDIKMIL